MSNHRDWSSLGAKGIRVTSDHLNAIDHVRFRSVKAPLVILIYCADPPYTNVNDFSFFDMTRREIIPARPVAVYHASCSYYCGSSHGWLFIAHASTEVTQGGVIKEEQRISLLNPFTDDIIQLPLLHRKEQGRVLLSHPPPDLHNNINSKVVYLSPGHDHNTGTQVSFLRVGHAHEWTTFTFPPDFVHPVSDNVIAFNAHFSACFKGILVKINLETHWLDTHQGYYILPGMHPDLAPDGLLYNLRFFQDVGGDLHLICSSILPHTYSILQVYVVELVDLDQYPFRQPMSFDLHLHPAMYFNPNRFLMILQYFAVHRVDCALGVFAQDFNALGLIQDLSPFWHDPRQHPWSAMGWITPDLRAN